MANTHWACGCPSKELPLDKKGLPALRPLSPFAMCGSFGPTKNIPRRYVRPGGGFVPNFQLFEKGDVNGEKEQKVYTFLKVSVGNLGGPPPAIQAAPHASQPLGMSWPWSSTPVRGLGRLCGPSAYCAAKARGGHPRGLQPSSHCRDGQLSILALTLGPFLKFSPRKVEGQSGGASK